MTEEERIAFQRLRSRAGDLAFLRATLEYYRNPELGNDPATVAVLEQELLDWDRA